MSYYWTYYVAVLLASYLSRRPALAVTVLVFYFLRPVLPDPIVLWSNLVRTFTLRPRAHANPADLVSRRELGLAYLELLRPRAALRFLDEARAIAPKSQEIAYLRGTALLRIGENEEAVRAFAVAVGVNPDAPDGTPSERPLDPSFGRYGEAYLLAALALERVERCEQAEHALEMASGCNSSWLEPHVRLAELQFRRHDAGAARESLERASKTWHSLPWFARRKQVGWRVRGVWTSLFTG